MGFVADELSLALPQRIEILIRRALIGARLAAPLGLTLISVALARYPSPHPSVFRWSATYFAVILAVSGLAALLWSRSWRLLRTPALHLPVSSSLVDFAWLTWGVALLIAAIPEPVHAGDVLNGNLIGFEVPAATLIGWLPLALVMAAVLLHPPVWSLLQRKPALLSLVSLAVVAILAEGLVRCWTVINPEVQAFPTHRTEMWLRRYAPLNAAGLRQGDD